MVPFGASQSVVPIDLAFKMTVYTCASAGLLDGANRTVLSTYALSVIKFGVALDG
jgi:hypothetical protein